MKRFLIAVAIFFFLISASQAESHVIHMEEETILSSETVDLSFPEYVNKDTLDTEYIKASLPQRRPILRITRQSGLIQFPADTVNRNLYMKLRENVTAVANGTKGEVDDSDGGISTVFCFSAEEIFPQTVFTAEDLGVERLFDEDGSLNADARAAFRGKIAISFQPVSICVINDSPYELYWFGRVARAESSFSMGFDPDQNALILSGTYTVTFSVSRDYAIVPSGWDGEELLSRVDTDKYGSVTRARNKIESILREADSLGITTDEALLSFFARKICGLVSYNHSAQQSGESAYGDPWQLIWVFDQKSEHQVVCEGYSKAFEYLCGLKTREAVVISVRGSIPGGPHMWNVVSIDGHNYIVDLTNYDNGYDLYMVGADGNVADGYDTKALKGYVYSRDQMSRTDEELTIAPFSYAEWKAETTEAPGIRISSNTSYPGYKVVLDAQSSGGMLPVERIVVTNCGETEFYDGSQAEIEFTENAQISVAAVVDGRTTATAGPYSITVEASPTALFFLPDGARVETEAFAGISAPLIRTNGNDFDPDAFEADAIFAVEEVGDWFDSGYRFVIKPRAGEEDE